MLKYRVIVGFLLAGVCVAVIFLLPLLLVTFFFCLFIGMGSWEWSRLAGINRLWQKVLYLLVVMLLCYLVYNLPVLFIVMPAVVWWLFALVLLYQYSGVGSIIFLRQNIMRMLMGLIALVPAWAGLVYLIKRGDLSLVLMLLLFVWATDIGAYFCGKRFGRRKLASFISPGKTVEGVVGGAGLALAVAVISGLFLSVSIESMMLLLLLSLVTALATVVGDLVESMLKRESNLKDSGNILPGHGGLLDRIDGLIAAVPVFVLFIYMVGV